MTTRAPNFAGERSRKTLALFVLVPLMALWLVVYVQLHAEENNVRLRAEAHSQLVARNVANHMSHVLRQADHATQLFKLGYESSGGAATIARLEEYSKLEDSVAMAPLELPTVRIDRTGRVVDSAHGITLFRLPAPTMRALQDERANTAFVSTVRVPGESSDKSWRIEVARRLVDKHGDFDGAIVLMIDPAYFAADFERHGLSPTDLLAVGSRVDHLVSGRIGARMFHAFDPALSGAAGGLPADPGSHGAMRRIYAFQDVANAPVVVAAGIDEGKALAEFRRHRALYLMLTGAASLLIAAAFVALMRQGRRLADTMQQVHSAQGRLRAAIDGSSDSFFILKALRDAGGRIEDFDIVDLNERGAAMAGKTRADLLGKPAFRTLAQFAGTGLFERYCDILAGATVVSEEIELHPVGEPPRWIYHQVVPIEGGIAISARDISVRKHAELEIRDHRTFLMSLIEHVPLLVAVRTARRGEPPRIVVWNKAAVEMTGHAAQDVIGKSMADAFPPGFGLSGDGAGEHDHEVGIKRKDGTERCLHSITVTLDDEDGQPEYVLCIAEDITLRREQETQLRLNAISLRESEARLRTVADTIPAMVAYVDAAQVYRFHNRAFVPEFDARGDVIGTSMRDAIGPQRYARIEPYVRRVLAGERLEFEDADMRNGEERTMQVTYIPQFSEDGAAVLGFHIIRQDVTDQKREKKRLLKLARHDPLTGLANRAGFDVRLREAMAQCAAAGTSMALMFVDIDRFKPVNDTHGHVVGDELLKAIAARMTHALRSSDTVARLGGDEFTVIIEHVQKPEDASHAAAKLVAALHPPFELPAATVSISASIGVAIYTGDATSAGVLLQRADDMLYEAKEAGRDTFRMAV